MVNLNPLYQRKIKEFRYLQDQETWSELFINVNSRDRFIIILIKTTHSEQTTGFTLLPSGRTKHTYHKSKSKRKNGENLSLGKAILLRHQVKHQLLRDAVPVFEADQHPRVRTK